MSLADSAALNSDLLRSFLAVAEAGNVTQAATVIGRTQSAVSLQIQRLEGLLGVQLFQRSSRGVALTEEGRRLLPVARRALMEIERAGALFRDPLQGRIRVGIPDDYNERYFQRALAIFQTRHRAVEIFVKSGCTAGFPDSVRRGELDVAVFSAVSLEGQKPFYVEPTHWVASTDFILDRDAPLPIALYDRHCPWREAATAALDSASLSWRLAYLSENFTSVKAAIAAGLAIGFLTESSIGPGLRVLDEGEGLPPLPQSSMTLLLNDKADRRVTAEMGKAICAAVGP